MGKTQTGIEIEGRIFPRVHGFYYEPSYAAAAWSFGYLWLLPQRVFLKNGIDLIFKSFILLGVFITTSRLGILLIFCGTFGFTIASLFSTIRWRYKWQSIFSLFQPKICVAGIVILFLLSSGGQRYFSFLIGPLGLKSSLCRIVHDGIPSNWTTLETKQLFCGKVYSDQTEEIESQPYLSKGRTTSEGNRIQNLIRSFNVFLRSPWLGHGVRRWSDGRIKLVSESTWFEILIETGIVGLIAFIGALGMMLKVSLNATNRSAFYQSGLLIPLLIHFGISWNLSYSVLPRLDQWVLLFTGLAFYRFNRKMEN